MKEPGLVYTFYSFKGGVGRTMALANVAALLAKWGQKVLVLDWDLEAPGIDRYFLNSPSFIKTARSEKDGIIDIILAFISQEPIDWRKCLLEAFPFKESLPIHIISAGRETKEYNARLQQIAWIDLFSRTGFGAYLEALR